MNFDHPGVDTSALDRDPILDLAREQYENSPLRGQCGWDELSPTERSPWYRRAASSWLTQPPVERPGFWARFTRRLGLM